MIVLLELALAAGSATLLGTLLYRLLRRPAPEPEAQSEDPLAPVGAPRKPRPPTKAAAVALEEPDEDER